MPFLDVSAMAASIGNLRYPRMNLIAQINNLAEPRD